MKLTRAPFEQIKSGTKVIESRLFDEKRKKISVGDDIVFTLQDDPAEKIHVKVIDLHHALSFSKLFNMFPPAAFGGQTAAQLAQQIHTYYSPEQEQQYGVLGIRIQIEKEPNCCNPRRSHDGVRLGTIHVFSKRV